MIAAAASDWHEAAEKARYLLNLFAASPGGVDARRRRLIDAVLEDFDRLSREPSDQCSREGCAIQYHRKPHEPTAKELKEQAERDAWRAKYPSVYAERQTKVSRTWDWFSSGRLSLGLYSIDRRDNYREFCADHCYDGPTSRVEDHLNAVVIALVSAAVLIEHKRAVAAEQARIRAEEVERRRREEARKERAEQYLFKIADAYSKFRSMGQQ